MSELTQIGAVADRTGLSLRTIRYYEEVGLVMPSERSAGGFRLYSEDNVAQLRLIKQMKPLDFSLEQMRDLLATVAALEELERGENGGSASHRAELEERLGMFCAIVDTRVETLREQLHRTEDFAARLRAPTPPRQRG